MYESGREREGGDLLLFARIHHYSNKKPSFLPRKKRIDTGLGREGDPRADDKEDFSLLLSLLPLSIVSYLPPSLDSDETDNLIFGSHERGERQRRGEGMGVEGKKAIEAAAPASVAVRQSQCSLPPNGTQVVRFPIADQ